MYAHIYPQARSAPGHPEHILGNAPLPVLELRITCIIKNSLGKACSFNDMC